MPLIELAGYYQWLPEESATKAAQAGDRAGRRWSEQTWMEAAQITYLQTLVRVLWVGLRLKGDPPKPTPVKAPEYHRPETEKRNAARDRAYQAMVADLRKLSPNYRPEADQQAGEAAPEADTPLP